MIPSLVARELREVLLEYLSTTFALSEDAARQELVRFLTHPEGGVFRGPFLRVRTPLRQVPNGWVPPLDWLPDGFRPYVHQARAFERLSSRGREPQPVIVTTGTGSGKTEAFLYPIIDHCLRERAAGRQGVKALLLYPMNALAADQARRLAELLHTDPRLGGVTAGLYVGGDGRHETVGPDHLIDRRSVLRAWPPDILLTNYKMLDLLLSRPEDRGLWEANEPGTLRYVVLDEFHTYDGAQGTDVAMLLRRLGARLGQAEPGRPLGPAAPVATSATLGGGSDGAALREFAEQVFGVPFPEGSVIGEDRLSVEEACGQVDYTLPIPEVEEVLKVPEQDLPAGLVPLFTKKGSWGSLEELGEVLQRHPLTRAVLLATGERARPWRQAVEMVVDRAPSWGRADQEGQDVGEALARFVALLSWARRPGGRPLYSVEVQLWVREVSRLLRRVAPEPSFRWLDSAGPERAAEGAEQPAPELPAVYCRHCGRSGWLALAAELDGSLVFRPEQAYRSAITSPGRTRALIPAAAGEPGARYLDPRTRELLSAPQPGRQTIPVLVTPGEAEAARSACPSCGHDDGITFLGARVASLASVCITQLFGSPLVAPQERKLLAFTDSVQDAAHRAAFFSGRTYRFNLRTLIAGVVMREGAVSLTDLGGELLAAAGQDPEALLALTPPDLLNHKGVRALWKGGGGQDGRDLLADRLRLEAALEVGLRARIGRTLELTRTLAAAVEPRDPHALAGLVAEAYRHVTGQPAPAAGERQYAVYLRGLLERLRLQGGIHHRWLEPYIKEHGNAWRLWGGRPDGMPAFPSGQRRPAFLTTGQAELLDSLTASGHTPTWVVDWAGRTLGLPPNKARALNRHVADLIAASEEEVLRAWQARGGHTVYGLDPQAVVLHDVPGEAGEPAPSLLRCDTCLALHAAPPDRLEDWVGTPCLRYRCPGAYQPAPAEQSSYYRRLYRSGTMRRVVTAEHTGLLSRAQRERLEAAFKAGTAPDAPNVIACTPTMELGIDIGGLSAVLLTSVPRRPAAYLQRVGRAGRLSGNALVMVVLPTEPHALYFLAQPEHMLDGEVRPPGCYLDASEILRRQYLAYLLDLAAAGAIPAPPLPRTIGEVVSAGLEPGSWMGAILAAAGQHARAFLALFGDQLATQTAVQLEAAAQGELRAAVEQAFGDWRKRYRDLERRRDRLKESIAKLEERPVLEEGERRELSRLRGERAAVVALMQGMRQQNALVALVELGLLPNYTLLDDAVTLEATLWSEEGGEYETAHYTYQRPGPLALTEFAPGNSFYVQQHRLVVDALEVGSHDQPLYEWWRLCPQCGFGRPEGDQAAWASCPSCGSDAIADTGARHQMLRLRRVYSFESEERARVLDESEERARRRYHAVTAVDVDRGNVERAWRHTGATFGVELVRSARIRWVNFGLDERPGGKVQVAGWQVPAPRFRTCRYCGVVDGARGGDRASHRGWCYTRSGARVEAWEDLVLFHELDTEAVRLLLPVATFEVAERLASFKAALLLGLRLDFRGEPEHLAVTIASHPGSGGPGQRHLLVLYDTVPGGTGYLGRVADPERLRRILERAREAIARCPCQDEETRLAACHRCLLATAGSQEVELVSRGLALELLDQILDGWRLEPVPSVVDIDIGAVEESELERRFRVALRAWAARRDNAGKVTLTVRPRRGGRDALELRLTGPEGTARWLVEEQVEVGGTRPDYLITRQDGRAPEVAVYLDGFHYHASHEHNRLADDAAKRRELRASGRLVWNLTWEDVNALHEAAVADVPRKPPIQPLLGPAGRQAALRTHQQRPGRKLLPVGVAEQNPMQALLDFLACPDMESWEQVALSAVAGLAREASGAGRKATIQREGTRDLVAGALAAAPWGPHLPAGPVLALRWVSPDGLPLTLLLDGRPEVGGPDRERWTVLAVLDDRPEALSDGERHHNRWRAWLQWANLLQFLRSGGREALIATVGEAATLDPGDLAIVPTPAEAVAAEAPPPAGEVAPAGPAAPTPSPAGAPPGGELEERALEELELILDEDARNLTQQVLRLGAPLPVAGYELNAPDRWVVEVAWPQQRVALLTDQVEARDRWLEGHGWDARPCGDWTPETLLDVIRARAPEERT